MTMFDGMINVCNKILNSIICIIFISYLLKTVKSFYGYVENGVDENPIFLLTLWIFNVMDYAKSRVLNHMTAQRNYIKNFNLKRRNTL